MKREYKMNKKRIQEKERKKNEGCIKVHVKKFMYKRSLRENIVTILIPVKLNSSLRSTIKK